MTFEKALVELKRGKMISRRGDSWIWIGSSGQGYYGNRRDHPTHFCDSLMIDDILASDWKVKDEGDTKMGTDYSEVGAVCRECAKAAGFTPKDKAVGVWMDECGICHKQKPCTNLWHDWQKKPNNKKEH